MSEQTSGLEALRELLAKHRAAELALIADPLSPTELGVQCDDLADDIVREVPALLESAEALRELTRLHFDTTLRAGSDESAIAWRKAWTRARAACAAFTKEG